LPNLCLRDFTLVGIYYFLVGKVVACLKISTDLSDIFSVAAVYIFKVVSILEWPSLLCNYSATIEKTTSRNLNVTVPNVKFTVPEIEVRKDTQEPQIINYSSNMNVDISFTRNTGITYYSSSLLKWNNNISIDTSQYPKGTYYFDMNYTTANWKFTVLNALRIDVDREAYSTYYAPPKAINETDYQIYSPDIKVFYLLPYEITFDKTIEDITSEAIETKPLVNGWNSISLSSDLNDKVFNAYVVNIDGTIETSYILPIQELNTNFNIFRENDTLYFDTNNTATAYKTKSFNGSKELVSVLGNITLPISSSGIVETEYEIQYEDYETDPQKNYGYRYVHDPTVFENNQGVADFNNQILTDPITNFTKVGKYEMYFQVQDNVTSIDEIIVEKHTMKNFQ